jgi:hypothetical protein
MNIKNKLICNQILSILFFGFSAALFLTALIFSFLNLPNNLEIILLTISTILIAAGTFLLGNQFSKVKNSILNAAVFFTSIAIINYIFIFLVYSEVSKKILVNAFVNFKLGYCYIILELFLAIYLWITYKKEYDHNVGVNHLIKFIKKYPNADIPIDCNEEPLKVNILSLRKVIQRYDLLSKMVRYNDFKVILRANVGLGASLLEAHNLCRENSALEAMETPFSLPREGIESKSKRELVAVIIKFINAERRSNMGDYWDFEGYVLSLLVDIKNQTIWDARGENVYY